MEFVKAMKHSKHVQLIVQMSFQAVIVLTTRAANQAVKFMQTMVLKKEDGKHLNQALKITKHHIRICTL